MVETQRVRWNSAHRLILSKYPPIQFFEDVADPEDWEILANAASRTNPRLLKDIGDLSLVPVERRVSGVGASWVMAAFTHISQDRKTRFSDGSYGVYYAGDTVMTALHEHIYHMSKAYAATKEEAGWVTTVRELVCKVDKSFHDLRKGSHSDLLDKDDYSKSHEFGKQLQQNGENGVVYPSQRYSKGECIAALFPDVVKLPVQVDHYRYHWNGQCVDYVEKITGERTVFSFRPE